ncbi:MAG TPA: asparagine synthase (glutamine-hydrolyzing) [bacterium]|nr:asparagine synthase (glutamine-hydrolyzing) [bacterium]
MCGISGFTGSALGPDRADAVIRAMCDAIRHRGPDDDGYYVGAGAVLGARRLSIIDVGGGHQPIGNEDGTVWVAFNGEIYNFLELRADAERRGHRFRTRSDTEVLVHLYEDRGPDLVSLLDGMFAFAIWDGTQRRLVLARDRMGKKPLHYTFAGDGLVFASELKALLRHPLVARTLSAPALARYLAFDYVPAPHTIFQGISKLPPGYVLVYEDGRARLTRYWDLPAPGDDGVDVPEAAERLAQLLDAATQRRLISDVPLGAFLSGGIDSSAVTALMARHASTPVKTFSIGFEEPSFDESRYAREVAACLGTDHHEEIMAPRVMLDLAARLGELLDEPLADASILPTYLLSRFTRRHVTVALSGDGGDELFAGYPTYQAHQIARRLAWTPRPVVAGARALAARLPVSYGDLSLDFRIRRFLGGVGRPLELRHAAWLGTFAADELPTLLAPDVWQQVRSDDLFSEVRGHVRAAEGRDWLGTLLYLDAKLYLQDGVLVKVDRASMACSLEVRSPFLDTAVVEFASRLPARQKLRGLTTKFLLKRSLRGVLPDRILDRRKKGFGMPVGMWIRGPWRELFRDVLAPDRLARQGLLNPQAVTRLLSEHLEGTHDHRKKLWNLLVLQLWYRSYLEDSAA